MLQCTDAAGFAPRVCTEGLHRGFAPRVCIRACSALLLVVTLQDAGGLIEEGDALELLLECEGEVRVG